jgi:DNA polymerase elongation subunit (family B)
VQPRILLLDIETSPLIVYAWTLQEQRIPIDRIVEDGHTMCWSAKWYGERDMMFSSTYTSTPAQMLRRIHKLLDEADAVVTYNGKNFDLPTLDKEFFERHWLPPSPYKHIDLLETARKFRFPSRKLDWVAQRIGRGKKTKHKGMDLWKACMADDPTAWRVMERYNRRDVTLLEGVYEDMRPWIRNHPNIGAYTGESVCPNCGSADLQRRGVQVAAHTRYQRLQCQGCGAWSRMVNKLGPSAQVRSL